MTYNASVWGNDPLPIVQGCFVCPGVPCTQAVRHARRFHDDGFEIRHLLQRAQVQIISVGERFYKLSVQALVDTWGVDDVESSRGEGEGGCLDAASDDDLRFICETLVGLVRGW
jgi:hypothetical protein